MIITHNTGKAELCFVKVDNDAFDFNVFDGNELFFKSTMNGAFSKVNPFYRTLPEGNWQIVGNPFELSEVQCQYIMPLIDRVYGYSYIDYSVTYKNLSHGYTGLAKESFNSLLKHLNIYQTNPYGNLRLQDSDAGSELETEIYPRWKMAQERTGSFILLKKIAP